MKIDDVLINRNFEEKKTLIALLANMMIADGRIHKNEQNFLYSKASKLSLTQVEIKKIMTDTMLGIFRAKIPKDSIKRYSLLIDIVIMMFIDNEIHEKEVDLCKNLSSDFGYSEEIIPSIIKIIKDSYHNDLSYTACFHLLKKLVDK